MRFDTEASATQAAWSQAEAVWTQLPITIAASAATVAVALLAVAVPYWQRWITQKDARAARANDLLGAAAIGLVGLRQVTSAQNLLHGLFHGSLSNVDDEGSLARVARDLAVATAALRHRLDRQIDDLDLVLLLTETEIFVQVAHDNVEGALKQTGLDRWKACATATAKWANLKGDVESLEQRLSSAHRQWATKAKS